MEKIKCPHCGKSVIENPISTWVYGVHIVSNLRCMYCKKTFRYYKSSKKTFTIPKPKW